jgi:hypothetical protein
LIWFKDNAETHDKEPFVVFGEVIEGMDAADALYAEYGEAAGGASVPAGRIRCSTAGTVTFRRSSRCWTTSNPRGFLVNPAAIGERRIQHRQRRV